MIKKFRVKDLKTQKYLSSYAERGLLFLYETRWVDVGWFIQCEQLEYPKRFKVEQFTCSYDKNKTEIYEGDILRKSDFGYFVVNYSDMGRFGPYLPSSNGWSADSYEVVLEKDVPVNLCPQPQNDPPIKICNPFPEHGEILKIQILAEYSHQTLYDNALINLTYKRYPDVYTLKLYYKNDRLEFQAFNLKEEDYHELRNTYLKNVQIKFHIEGWPSTLKWKNFEFKLASITSEPYVFDSENSHK